jgi:acetolactate synthase regulatory subunit
MGSSQLRVQLKGSGITWLESLLSRVLYVVKGRGFGVRAYIELQAMCLAVHVLLNMSC